MKEDAIRVMIVDDHDMGVTHIVRGDDHLNNTPRQMNMLEALGAGPPVYAHLPMILGPDGGKLSKRHGAVDIREYKEEGYLPEAMLNYLVRLGWSHGDQEIFSVDEMIELFDIGDVNKSASTFDIEKLTWELHYFLKHFVEGHRESELTVEDRATLAEAFLEGMEFGAVTDDVLRDVGIVAAGESDPLDYHRASAEYRREMVGVLTRRLVGEIIKSIKNNTLGGMP